MARTEANVRAAIHNAESEDEHTFAETPVVKEGGGPRTKSSAGAALGLRLHLDVAAPRILVPDRLWPRSSSPDTNEYTGALGVLCDLGHLRLSNWSPPVVTEADNEDDAFVTPCGSPTGSDNEGDGEMSNPPPK